jgi:eukaryotic-like serine/threonine-protein kinase
MYQAVGVISNEMSDEADVLYRASQRIGTVLRGKYRLDAVLGIGGMAVVYAATHRNQKRFAVKLLHAELAVRSEFRARFAREGYVANAVAHGGVVSVLDDDVDETGMAFLVMDLLRGADVELLRSRAEGKLPLQLTLTVVTQVLSVLEAAHARGVVHRDLKPANFFVTRVGQVKVLDFGVAQLREGASSVQATRSGAVLGTPAFMAPEQAAAQHREVEARTDLWALGASMFTLLSGQFVHEAENGDQTMIQAATKSARSLASVAPELPISVIELVDKALSFDKAARFASAAAMSEALLTVSRELFGELSREPLIARLDGVDAPRIRVSQSVVSALGRSETTADSPLAADFRSQRVVQKPVRKQKRNALLLALAAALLAVLLIVRATSSTSPRRAAEISQKATLNAAQPAVLLTLPATVEASIQTSIDPLPVPPRKLVPATHPRAQMPTVTQAKRSPSALQPTTAEAPVAPAPSNPLELELQ